MWPQTRAEAAPLIVEAIGIFGKFRPEALSWLVPFVLQGEKEGDWNTYLAMVQEGEPVSTEEKGAWGHPERFVFCRPCWDYMTDAGRYQPREAVAELLQHVFWRQRLNYRRWQIADLLASTMIRGRPFYDAIQIRADDLCCPAARKLKDVGFPVERYPDLPLAACGQLWCKCDWDPIRNEREAPASQGPALDSQVLGERAGRWFIRLLLGKDTPPKS